MDFDKLPLRLKNAYSIFKPQNPRFSKLDRIMHYFLYAFCVPMGLLLIIFCFNRIYLARQSLHWENVPGKIIASYISIGGKNNGIIYFKATYRYSVSGIEYVGYDVNYGAGSSMLGEGREAAEAKAARYPAGASATVFYDPVAPEHSCLEQGGDLGGYFFLLGGGSFLIVFGVWGFFRLVRPKKKS